MKQNIFFLLAILCLAACKNNPKGDRRLDAFYTEKGGFDWARIPLVKPYEIVNSSRENYWIIRCIGTSEVPLNIPGVRNISVLDSAIFIYGKETVLNGQQVNTAWFVVLPKNRTCHGFIDHQAYLNYIHSIGLNEEPKLYNAMDVFQYFDKNDTVDWRRISTSLKAVN